MAGIRAMVASLGLGLVVSVGVVGCNSSQPPPPVVPNYDFRYFVCVVDPILEQDCSYPACHGQEAQPLRIYSLGKLRDPALALDDWDRSHRPLTHSELNQNFNSALAFFIGVDKPTDSLVLREPLPASEGGPTEHFGGAVWGAPAGLGTNDPRYQAILNWTQPGTNIHAITDPNELKKCQALLAALGE
jgi:hypothetical protein